MKNIKNLFYLGKIIWIKSYCKKKNIRIKNICRWEGHRNKVIFPFSTPLNFTVFISRHNSSTMFNFTRTNLTKTENNTIVILKIQVATSSSSSSYAAFCSTQVIVFRFYLKLHKNIHYCFHYSTMVQPPRRGRSPLSNNVCDNLNSNKRILFWTC